MNKIKTFFRKLYYIHLLDYIYSFRYYLKSSWNDFIEILSRLKNPKTWSSILFITCIITIVTKRYSLFTWLIPLLILVGMIRQKKTRNYKKELIKNALLKNNDLILTEEYNKYKRDCFFSKKQPLEFPAWKNNELEKVQKNSK